MANWTDWINASGIDLENLTEEIVVEYDAFTGPQTSTTYDIDFTDLVYLEVRIDSWTNSNTNYYPNAYMYLDADSNVRWGIGGPNAGSGTGILVNTMGLVGLHTLHFVNPSGSAQHVGHIKVYRSEGYSIGNFGSGTVDAFPKIISVTTTANQEIYTFKEDYECVFIPSANVGYIASELCDKIISGTEYAWGSWQANSIFKGVHVGFQIQFGYAGTYSLYVTQTLKKIDTSKTQLETICADVEFTATGDYRTITADLSQYFTNYADLTADDILVDLGTSNVIRPNVTGGVQVEFTKSYDATTGILTIQSSVDGLAYALHLPLKATVHVLKSITFGNCLSYYQNNSQYLYLCYNRKGYSEVRGGSGWGNTQAFETPFSDDFKITLRNISSVQVTFQIFMYDASGSTVVQLNNQYLQANSTLEYYLSDYEGAVGIGLAQYQPSSQCEYYIDIEGTNYESDESKTPITFHYMPAGATNTQYNIFSKNTNTVRCISASGGEVSIYGATSLDDTSGTLLGVLTTGAEYDISQYDFFRFTHGSGIAKPDVTIEF